jgi:hypothetical protein
MSKSVFFSWASDFDKQKSHNDFIINCLKIVSKRKMIKNITVSHSELENNDKIKDYKLSNEGKIEVQSATYGEKGSPNIKDTIFNRISQCSIYVCDVSIALCETEVKVDPIGNWPKITFEAKMKRKTNGRLSPNPNVLIELGYAMSVLGGWEKIILLFDNDNYKVEELPFDIRQQIPIIFSGQQIDKELKLIDSKNMDEDTLLYEYQKHKHLNAFYQEFESKIAAFDSPIEDYMQNQIDSILFGYLYSFSNMLYTLERAKNDIISFLQISQNELEQLIDNCEGGYFQIPNLINYYCEHNEQSMYINIDFMTEISKIYQSLLSSTYNYDRKWINCFIKFQTFIHTNYRVLFLLCKFDNRLGIKDDIKSIKNDFVSLIIDFQIIINEWLSITNREGIGNSVSVSIPKYGKKQLEFTDNEKRNNNCYLELNNCKYFYKNGKKQLVE